MEALLDTPGSRLEDTAFSPDILDDILPVTTDTMPIYPASYTPDTNGEIYDRKPINPLAWLSAMAIDMPSSAEAIAGMQEDVRPHRYPEGAGFGHELTQFLEVVTEVAINQVMPFDLPKSELTASLTPEDPEPALLSEIFTKQY